VRLPDTDLALVEAYCVSCSPPEHAAEARVEWTVSGNAITIVEASRLGAERDEDWLRVPCARLTYDPDDQLWTLFCFDPDSREQRYDVWEPDFIQPTSVEAILAEIEADPTEVFWG
jgi:hypothetical protein